MPPCATDLLADAPPGERALRELAARWPALPDAHARVAARLRVFVVNWNPLAWCGEPFASWATATGDGDGFELVLYVPLPEATDETWLGELCRSTIEVGVQQELVLVSGAYAQLAHAGKVPELLSATGQLTTIAPPTLEPVADGWEPIGLGAIRDVVQARFGPVDLDRAAVALDAVAPSAAGCPACAGERFGFPAEFAEAQLDMCAPHEHAASEIVAERLRRAEASNRDGWLAIADASAALAEPTYGLPLAFLEPLQEALHRTERTLDTARADAATALELAAALTGRPEDFAEWVETWMAHDWVWELPQNLAQHGCVDEAVRVADAFNALHVGGSSILSGDAAVILARAKRPEEARERAEANLRAFPRDVWTQLHAGDVFEMTGDTDRGQSLFRRGLAMAQASGNRHDIAGAAERLAALLAAIPGREDEASSAAREAGRSREAEYRPQRTAIKPGRNAPCPCGSGRKFKKCCGAH